MSGDVNSGRVSERELSLDRFSLISKENAMQEKTTHLASDREAALAITVFDKF